MSGPPGTTFIQWGKGSTPDSTATVHLKKPDGTEADPRDRQIDVSGKFEATYTPAWDAADGTYTWWVVDGFTGQRSKEVPFKISAESYPYFFFNNIPGQTENQQFSVTLTAKDAGWQGEVVLNSNVGEVSPTRVKLINGVWEGSLKVLNAGDNVYLTATGKVLYRSATTHASNKKNFEVFSAEELIAAITQHTPDKGFQMVRYNGWYSSRSIGERIKAGVFRPGDEPASPEDHPQATVLNVSDHQPRRVPSKTWRELRKKIWEADPLSCPRCAHEMKIISLINDSDVIARILRHPGLWKQPPGPS